jgi:hypothetical protein
VVSESQPFQKSFSLEALFGGFTQGRYNVSEFVFPFFLEVEASFWG